MGRTASQPRQASQIERGMGFSPDALQALGRVSSPVLIAHSRQDDIVPFHHGERLFAAVKGPKAFLELAGGHNDDFLFTREARREALGRFWRSTSRRAP